MAQEREGVGRGQVVEQLAALTEDRADAIAQLLSLLPRNEPQHARGAGARVQDAREDLDGGRLARAVGADEGHALAALDAEADVVDRDD